jgi:uncharacterized membrane protein
MNKKIRNLTLSAMLAALYVVLTHFQNMLFPNSASMAVQFRISEALCVLAFFTPAAIPGLSLGCLIFNLTFGLTSGVSLPLDFLVGTGATALSTWAMWLTRKLTINGYPLLGLLMPALFNGILVGWELSVYIGGGFTINALLVAVGEAVVLLLPGTVLYYALRKRNLF